MSAHLAQPSFTLHCYQPQDAQPSSAGITINGYIFPEVFFSFSLYPFFFFDCVHVCVCVSVRAHTRTFISFSK